MPVARGEEKRVALSGAMDGDFQTRFPNKLVKLGVYVLAFVVLGVGYSYPDLARRL